MGSANLNVSIFTVGFISITHNSIEKVSTHCLAVKNLQQKTGSPEKGGPF
jgi:hypothetical protein